MSRSLKPLNVFSYMFVVCTAILMMFAMTDAHAQIVINEVEYCVNDLVEIKNLGSSMQDISSWLLCSRFVYASISSLTVMSGSTTLAPNDVVVLSEFSMDNTAADLGLYNSGDFGSADAMEAFVQWREPGTSQPFGRESVAVTKGIWTAGDFVPTVACGNSIEYDGAGNASTDWFDQAVPTFGNDNSLPVELSLFTATKTKDGVLLQWRTESETSNLGFDIYRIENGNAVKVSARIIKGHGTTGATHDYQFLDPDAPEGVAAKYFIEDVAFSGARAQSHTIRVRSTLPTTWGRMKQER